MSQSTIPLGILKNTQHPSYDPLREVDEQLKPLVNLVLAGNNLPDDAALALARSSFQDLGALCHIASTIRDRGKGRIVSFSPKVFIPLTQLCRDFCGYCTFRKSPSQSNRLYVTPEEALEIAQAGERMGCTEALFTLGERPEERYIQARQWLQNNGYDSTLEYLRHVSNTILNETSLLPHGNPGTMSRENLKSLKEVNVSVGVMLEILSQRLCELGGPHALAPSKWPGIRLRTMNLAGELKFPFTTGILIGIGETRTERIESLLAIRRSHKMYGHIQEVIIQNFRAKIGTAMANHKDATVNDLLWTVAVARLILGPSANIQIPPNLNTTDYPIFLLAGINDWGGISPITIDHVNPEAPWPNLYELLQNTRDLGFDLRPRLPIYPEYFMNTSEYLPKHLMNRVCSLVDRNGYVKGGIDRYVTP